MKKILSDIGGKRTEKQNSKKANDNISDMKNKTGEDLNEKIKENEETLGGTKAYEENKEEIENQKKRAATEDSEKYRQEVAIPTIKKSMTKNEVNENELDD